MRVSRSYSLGLAVDLLSSRGLLENEPQSKYNCKLSHSFHVPPCWIFKIGFHSFHKEEYEAIFLIYVYTRVWEIFHSIVNLEINK